MVCIPDLERVRQADADPRVRRAADEAIITIRKVASGYSDRKRP